MLLNSKDLVSIIIPAYKQASSIKNDISRIEDVMATTRFNFELIVVVDGFIDDTYEKAKELESEKVHVLGYQTNRGKGYAIRYGMARAKGNFVAFIDGGMEIDPNGISMILEHMLWYKADIIVGSKRHPASVVTYPLFRRIYSLGYSLICRILFRLKLTDTQAGLKIYRRDVLEKVLPRLVVKAYAFDIELLAVAKYLGFNRIYEAPIIVSLDFSSGGKLAAVFNKQIRDILYDTIAVFYRMYFLGYYKDSSKRKWIYDKELQMNINTGELDHG